MAKYYSIENVLKVDAEYNILFGERSNGKSYAVKEYCFKHFLEDGKKFVYLRRYSMDINNAMVQSYFDDIPIEKISKKEYNMLEVRAKKIYLCFYDNDQDKITKRKQCGYVMHLSGGEHYKSTTYPNTDTIIFEEFVTNEGYLLNEPTKLMNIISTVLRKNTGKIFMIGNTVNRICPYFSEWQLTNIPKQAQGTIDIYNVHYDELTVKIACEYCESATSKNKMIFGKTADNIVKGSWECDTYPKPPSGKHNILCKILLQHEQFNYELFLLNSDLGIFVKVQPVTKEILSFEKYSFVITKKFTEDIRFSDTLKYFPISKTLKKLYDMGKFTYSDNLTGTEFNNIYKDWGFF